MTIIINCLICRKLWLRKIPGNVTDTNLAAEKRLKRKVTRLLVITCVVFAVCWFPVYVNHYFRFVRPDQSHKLPFKVQLLFYWLAHANSALNPCLYILLNKRYRKAFFATLNNFWQFGSSKSPQSPTKGKSGQANLALSLVSIRDARSPPNNLTETSLNNNSKETKNNAIDDVIQV